MSMGLVVESQARVMTNRVVHRAMHFVRWLRARVLRVTRMVLAIDAERDEADRYVLQKVDRFVGAFRSLKAAELIPLVESRRPTEIAMASMAVDTAMTNLCGSASQLADLLRYRGIEPGVNL